MKKAYILNIWFVLALTILLLNDFVFKSLFGNVITGKLSDFTGLFVFSIFWYSIFPRYKKLIFIGTALAFVFWKSNYSQLFIEGWNDLFYLKINRVVDYWDLTALLILPLAYRIDVYQSKSFLNFKMAPVVVSCLALFAFASTSGYTEVAASNQYKFDMSLDSLNHKLNQLEEVSYSSVREMAYKKSYPDTIPMEIRVIDDYCSDGYTALITIIGDSLQSELWIEHFQYDCPKGEVISGEDDEETLIMSFEEKIVNQLK